MMKGNNINEKILDSLFDQKNGLTYIDLFNGSA